MAMFRQIAENDPMRGTLYSALSYYSHYYDVFIAPLTDYMRLDDDYCVIAQVDGSALLLVMEENSPIFETVEDYDAFGLYRLYANQKEYFFRTPFDIPAGGDERE